MDSELRSHGVIAKIHFFPVGCGDMTLVEFSSGKKLVIDVNIRSAADDPDDSTPDVAAMLKDRLNKDDKGRPYTDAYLTSHPDEDHCRGFAKHFYTGAPEDYPMGSSKILIRELWSSPIAFRRASANHTLSDDAKALNAEARRRVAKFRKVGTVVGDGDRILILGEDEGGKTDDLGTILVKVDQEIKHINGTRDDTFKARLLAPLPKDEEDEEVSKNDSSVVIQFTLNGTSQYLTGGDAEVTVWETLWERHKRNEYKLHYDLLLTPHHCSWHSLSHDSWSECGEDAKVSPPARNALSRTRSNARLMASSKRITDDDNDPPCIRAKREYEDIAEEANGEFLCVMEEIDEDQPAPIEFEVTERGFRRVGQMEKAKAVAPSVFSSGSSPKEASKQGGGRYA